jgi:hypothetical protein
VTGGILAWNIPRPLPSLELLTYHSSTVSYILVWAVALPVVETSCHEMAKCLPLQAEGHTATATATQCRDTPLQRPRSQRIPPRTVHRPPSTAHLPPAPSTIHCPPPTFHPHRPPSTAHRPPCCASQPLSTPALPGTQWSASASGCFTQGQVPPGCVGPSAGMKGLENTRVLPLMGIELGSLSL